MPMAMPMAIGNAGTMSMMQLQAVPVDQHQNNIRLVLTALCRQT